MMETVERRIGSNTGQIIEKSRLDYLTIDNLSLSQREIQGVLANLRHHYHQQLIFKIAICTGLRAQEIANLRVSDIDTKSQSIIVHKYRGYLRSRPRVVGLHPKLFIEIMRFVQSIGTHGYVFSGRDGSMSWRTIAYTLQKSRSVVTGERITVNQLIDSTAISFLQNGMNLKELRQALGFQTKRSMIKRFQKLATEENGRVEVFNSIFLKMA